MFSDFKIIVYWEYPCKSTKASSPSTTAVHPSPIVPICSSKVQDCTVCELETADPSSRSFFEFTGHSAVLHKTWQQRNKEDIGTSSSSSNDDDDFLEYLIDGNDDKEGNIALFSILLEKPAFKVAAILYS